MKLQRIILIVFSLILLLSSNCYSQELIADLQNSSARYQQAEEFSADMVIEIQYAEGSALKPFKKASIRKKGNNFHYTIDRNETIITTKKMILVNNRIKKIIYRDLKDNEQETIAKKYYQSGLDSVITRYDSAKYIGVVEKGKHYIIYAANNAINRTDIFIDEKTGYLNKIIYGYNQSRSKDLNKVVISFFYPTLSSVDEQFLKEEAYLVFSDKKYRPAPKYLNYELNKVDNE